MSENKKSSEVKTATVLAFERKLDPSDALFFSGKWDERNASGNWPTVTIHEKSVRGTISNRLKAGEQDPAKLDAAIEKPNLQTVDVATLPPDADTLKAQFTLRVLAGTGTPSACNNIDYRKKLTATVAGYVKEHSFIELARRYAANLANGRFLWRNRIGAEDISIRVAHLKEGKPAAQWTFDALDHSLRDLAESAKAQSVVELADLINAGLTGSQHVLLEITAFVRTGAGQEVFPSQELILERGRGDKSKTLYHVNNVAGIHSQKIGNALRTIDTWYAGAEENGPIAVEPYGSVTVQGKAWRQPKDKQDFYNLLDNWITKDQAPASEQQHYVMAVLVRGGVFGKAD
ncbi:type I-F CRISPR-associated protein Csy3 [Cephaloticoccus primus]|uniref:Type I-F CRISPR-associated protein Csy3 n=1 Tax=Cephaloticoccus primus TaxID=1548207 RepID=A0A139SI05_9BACT|nr:type I-F CRISPR-associated protein Csy3 [Cephaloticoccus primus]KXU34208.1 type I-F CRISPR-associated protein Csy3 [Cephaloticoccus primus]